MQRTERGNWVPEDKIDWYVPVRYEKLAVLLTEGKSAQQVADAFGDCTRSAVIGAVRRLRAGNYITANFERASSYGTGIPHFKARKDPTTTKREQEAIRSDRAAVRKIKRAAEQHNRPKKQNKVRHNVFVQDPLTREFVEVETQGWSTHEDLVAFNLTRLEHAVRFVDCEGCKFPVDDEPPFLFCNAEKTGNSPYCITHKVWTTGYGRSKTEE